MGVAVDQTVLGLGALVTVAFVVAVSAATVWRLAGAAHSEGAREAGHARRYGRARRVLAGRAVSGMRFALERRGGSTAVPVASSFAGPRRSRSWRWWVR